MSYGYKKQLGIPFAQAVERTKAALINEGFGILTEIDVRDTLQKKLNIKYDNYIILGVCNPSLAYQALQLEKEIGLLLPCNVIVYEDDGKVFASAILPTSAMAIINRTDVTGIAIKVEEKLKKAINLLT